jgi:hypothetical protein
MMYVPSFTKNGSAIQKLIGEIHIQTQTCREQGDLISLLFILSKYGK